ncbi:Hypothetical predicted protein, partial [Olea europaea subsp. europaea]
MAQIPCEPVNMKSMPQKYDVRYPLPRKQREIPRPTRKTTPHDRDDGRTHQPADRIGVSGLRRGKSTNQRQTDIHTQTPLLREKKEKKDCLFGLTPTLTPAADADTKSPPTTNQQTIYQPAGSCRYQQQKSKQQPMETETATHYGSWLTQTTSYGGVNATKQTKRPPELQQTKTSSSLSCCTYSPTGNNMGKPRAI